MIKLKSLWNKIKNSKQFIYLSSLGIGFWAFIIITIGVGFVSLFYVEEMIKLMISDYGYIGIFFIVLIIELLVQPTGPDLVIMLGLLSSLDAWTVFWCVLVASHLAFYISYVIGRKIGTNGVKHITGKKSMEKIQATTAQSGKWFMFLSAFTPLPYIPYLAGVWNFNFKDCMLYVIVPRTARMLIVLVLTYYFGVQLLDISFGDFIGGE